MTYQITANVAVNEIPFVQPRLTVAPQMSRLFELRDEDRREALEFLAIRPVHTIVMSSYINDNGIDSPLNRGTFFGYRGANGRLEGIALIGHATLVEARSEDALKALAYQARQSSVPVKLIMSSGHEAEDFWHYYRRGIHAPRLTCTELLFEVGFPYLVPECEFELRNARPDELMEVAEAQAEIALLESGVDPMVTDREGFLMRVLRRIEQGRVFVATEDGRIVFKAEIIAQTSEAAYLEGVYVAPHMRGQGVGSNCLAGLTLELLKRVPNVCLLSNINFIDAHMSYLKAGYRNTDSCTTIFV